MNKKTKPPIGTIAVQKGFVTSQQVEYALNLQRKRLAMEHGAIRLGHLLTELGYINKKQLSELLTSSGSKFEKLSEDAIRLAVRLKINIYHEHRVILMT